MTKTNRPMQPWQVFHAARVQLGAEVVARIFNRSSRSAYDWAQDPATTTVRCKSPLELLHILFERLDEQGRGYVVRAAIDYLETALFESHHVPERVVEPHPSLDVELLRDFSAVDRLRAAIADNAAADEVAAIAAAAKAEIERTLARYLQDERRIRHEG